MKLIFYIIILCLFNINVFAADWTYFSTSVKDDIYEYDKDSMDIIDNKIRVWWKIKCSKLNKISTLSYNVQKSLVSVNCKENNMAIWETSWFLNDELVKSDDKRGKYTYYNPDSIGYSMIKAFCKIFK